MQIQTTADNRPAKFGISAALTTPFHSDGSIDLDLALSHATWVLAQGASRITLFGTTGEGASLGRSERLEFLDHLLANGVSPDQIIGTICCSSFSDAIEQANEILARGVGYLLVTPPFYFKDISDRALVSWFTSFIEAIADSAPKLILYHIPQMTQVPLSHALVSELKNAFGDVIYGLKDSSGNWDNTVDMLSVPNLSVLVGDERLLAKAAGIGAAGAISGMANLFPGHMIELVETAQTNPMINSLVNDLVKHPVTPAIKALVGELHGQPEWQRTRAPLESTPQATISSLGQMFAEFNIRGLK